MTLQAKATQVKLRKGQDHLERDRGVLVAKCTRYKAAKRPLHRQCDQLIKEVVDRDQQLDNMAKELNSIKQEQHKIETERNCQRVELSQLRERLETLQADLLTELRQS